MSAVGVEHSRCDALRVEAVKNATIPPQSDHVWPSLPYSLFRDPSPAPPKHLFYYQALVNRSNDPELLSAYLNAVLRSAYYHRGQPSWQSLLSLLADSVSRSLRPGRHFSQLVEQACDIISTQPSEFFGTFFACGGVDRLLILLVQQTDSILPTLITCISSHAPSLQLVSSIGESQDDPTPVVFRCLLRKYYSYHQKPSNPGSTINPAPDILKALCILINPFNRQFALACRIGKSGSILGVICDALTRYPTLTITALDCLERIDPKPSSRLAEVLFPKLVSALGVIRALEEDMREEARRAESFCCWMIVRLRDHLETTG